QLLGVAIELGQRRCDQVHVAQQQGLHFLAIAIELRVGEDLHIDFVAEQLFGHFLELLRPLALGRIGRHDMAEFDDDGVVGEGTGGKSQSGGAAQRQQNTDGFHEVLLVDFMMFRGWSAAMTAASQPELPGKAYSDADVIVKGYSSRMICVCAAELNLAPSRTWAVAGNMCATRPLR